MEVYKNSTDAVTLEVPSGINSANGSVDIIAVENGLPVYEFETVVKDFNGYTVQLPWILTRQDRDLVIKWSFIYTDALGINHEINDQSYVQVVTPLLPRSEVEQISGLFMSDAIEIERRVRYAIQSYTGQSFGRFYGDMRVPGNGSRRLQLPAPLLELTNYGYDGVLRNHSSLRIINDGWALQGGSSYIDNIKQAPPEWMLDIYSSTGKITAPMRYGNDIFHDGVEYTVEGMWGYLDVPADVKQAARILIKDYSCDESLWRDRYLESIRAADWRLQFTPNAYTGTGNVQADQILEKYRRSSMMAVI